MANLLIKTDKQSLSYDNKKGFVVVYHFKNGELVTQYQVKTHEFDVICQANKKFNALLKAIKLSHDDSLNNMKAPYGSVIATSTAEPPYTSKIYPNTTKDSPYMRHEIDYPPVFLEDVPLIGLGV